MAGTEQKKVAWLKAWMILLFSIVLLIGIVGWLGPKFASRPHVVINATKVEINGNLKTALGQFEVNIGRFPTTAEGLKALVERPTSITLEKWQDPYMDSFPKDAWGHEFRYICPSPNKAKDYDLTSAGPDGIFGTRDDITNDLPGR
jgi:general secretion pathway protein G